MVTYIGHFSIDHRYNGKLVKLDGRYMESLVYIYYRFVLCSEGGWGEGSGNPLSGNPKFIISPLVQYSLDPLIVNDRLPCTMEQISYVSPFGSDKFSFITAIAHRNKCAQHFTQYIMVSRIKFDVALKYVGWSVSFQNISVGYEDFSVQSLAP